jgi:hypothetical protein
MKSQQLDLIYSQSRVLYEILLNAPRAKTNPIKPKLGPHVNGVIGFIGNV